MTCNDVSGPPHRRLGRRGIYTDGHSSMATKRPAMASTGISTGKVRWTTSRRFLFFFWFFDPHFREYVISNTVRGNPYRSIASIILISITLSTNAEFCSIVCAAWADGDRGVQVYS